MKAKWSKELENDLWVFHGIRPEAPEAPEAPHPSEAPEAGGRVVHCKKESYDVYIGRAPGSQGKWGNPFVIGPKGDGTRAEVIRKYRAYILDRPDLMAALPELRGKVLGCWCSPLPCHGDVLVELANREGTI